MKRRNIIQGLLALFACGRGPDGAGGTDGQQLPDDTSGSEPPPGLDGTGNAGSSSDTGDIPADCSLWSSASAYVAGGSSWGGLLDGPGSPPFGGSTWCSWSLMTEVAP